MFTYFVSQLQYGTKVADQCDKSCLAGILRKCLNEQIIADEKYKFCDTGSIYMPDDSNIE